MLPYNIINLDNLWIIYRWIVSRRSIIFHCLLSRIGRQCPSSVRRSQTRQWNGVIIRLERTPTITVRFFRAANGQPPSSLHYICHLIGSLSTLLFHSLSFFSGSITFTVALFLSLHHHPLIGPWKPVDSLSISVSVISLSCNCFSKITSLLSCGCICSNNSI